MAMALTMNEKNDPSTELEQVTAGLSSVHLGPQAPSDYEKAFNEIVRYAEKIRKRCIPPAELDVTKALAMPFTPGGLLIMLLEPRPNHPWSFGLQSVCSDCRTLQVIIEGLQIGSNGSLGLEHDVSLLDLRPFLCKRSYPKVQDEQWEELYDLVFSAVEAKQPDVFLCMGNEAQNALGERLRKSQLVFWQRTKIVRAIHPSRSVNYEETDSRLRYQLLKSICEACHLKDGEWNEKAWRELYDNGKLYRPSGMMTPALRSTRHMEKYRLLKDCLKACLRLTAKLCFEPDCLLPNASLQPGPYYYLENEHSDCLKHIRQSKAKIGTQTHARALLDTIFNTLNKSLEKTSWFQPTYKLKCKGIRSAVGPSLAKLEHDCNLLAGELGSEVSTEGEDALQHRDSYKTLLCFMGRMEAILYNVIFLRIWNGE
ncbi:hypothetical protein BKA66DRAFT_582940 [Pyrenochaeta sp. MPI-SDFR-AT-0127]|nr:hypothetical protein BKA66DRAFT_582940 [Pyrenochaeta sp. MPI-SDFR-AT-0127]